VKATLTIEYDSVTKRFSCSRPKSHAIALRLLHAALGAVQAEIAADEDAGKARNGKADIVIATTLPAPTGGVQ
jgi:hypothetical protein